MKKRSAMAIAGGLVAALLAAVIALSLGLTGTQPADATANGEPRVRTVHRTVTIAPEGPETVTLVAAGDPSSDGSGHEGPEDEGFDDDGSEHEGFDDHGSEHEDD